MAQKLVRFDWAMKRLLRSKANFGILEGFLSELLKRDLKIINILESESNKDGFDGKYNKVDILVELDTKELVLIEIQTNSESDYYYRMLFGTSKIVAEHIKKGDVYAKIKKVYSVNILYFDLGLGSDYVYHGTTKFVGIHEHDQLRLNAKQKAVYKKETIHQIYPEYYLIKVNQFNDVAKDTLDEWIYFLKNEKIEDNFKAKGLSEAKRQLDEMKLSDAEKKEYDKYLEDVRYQASIVYSNYKDGEVTGMLKGERIGIEKGKIEGEQIGMEKGERIGIEKGKIEGKIEVAKQMKKLGIKVKDIQAATGLDIEQLEKL
jgi:predicted transposase/invertase (TIGR01784 family)